MVRKRLGCSKRPPTQSTKDAYADLIAARNKSAQQAHAHLQSVQKKFKADANVGQKSSNQIKMLATTILSELELESGESSLENRLAYYPSVVLKHHDTEPAPEDVFDIFTSIETAISTFEASTKTEWMTNGIEDVTKLLGELAYIIKERTLSEQFLSELVDKAVSAFDLFFSSEQAWHRGSLAKLHDERKATLRKSVCDFYAAKINADAIEKRNALAKMKGASDAEFSVAKKKADDAVQTSAQQVYADQKNFFALEANRWVTQRNYLPEVYHDLYPDLKSSADLLLESIEVMEEYEAVTNLFANRTLEQYEDIKYLSPNILSCQFEKKAVLLKRFGMERRTEIKALFKELAMHKKLDDFVVADVSAVFVDNGDCYLHFARGGESWSSRVADKKITANAANAIMLVRQMCHVASEVHAAGVIHGDMRPESWMVNAQGVPKIHAFDVARVHGETTGVRESIIGPVSSIFDPPEVARSDSTISQSRTAAGDVFSLGKCIAVLSASSKAALDAADLSQPLFVLIEKMTQTDAKNRITSEEAFAQTDALLGLLHNEYAAVREEKRNLEKWGEALNTARKDLDEAALLAEVDLGKVAKRVEIVRKQELQIREKQNRLMIDHLVLKEREQKDDTLKPPPYWANKSLNRTVNIVPVDKNGKTFQVFRHILVTDEPESLNKGRDVVERGDYTFLDLVGVWRVENSLLWQNYATQRRNMRKMLADRHVKCPPFRLRERMERAQKCLPGADLMYKDINETYLLHGTGAEILLQITTNGINERFTSVALFGKGSYFAEDSGKTDQYVRGDPKLGGHPDLHRKLFPHGGQYAFPEYPYKAYYLLLCRLCMGYQVRVKCLNARKKHMENIDNPGGSIFATSDQRELAAIPGIDNPPIFYQSLVAEKGGEIIRFREMVQFHSVRVYPEYLICYSRR
eukprot:GEMP01002551.1.p1 GENE.GEMP01002551.1~~GEMP01002551.1.p1  ORF type:complete len:1061 (+),score=195.22 GEMP01002551.1:421-3183(+)